MTLQCARGCYSKWYHMNSKLVEMKVIRDYIVPDEQQCLQGV